MTHLVTVTRFDVTNRQPPIRLAEYGGRGYSEACEKAREIGEGLDMAGFLQVGDRVNKQTFVDDEDEQTISIEILVHRDPHLP